MKYAACESCGCVSSLPGLFSKGSRGKELTCPACHLKRSTRTGRWKWLGIPVAIYFLEMWVDDYSHLLFLHWFLFLAWAYVFTAVGIIVHELAHWGVTRLLGGICPIVVFGEGVPLLSVKTKRTLWQLCPSLTLGMAYCAYPADKQDVWRRIATLLAGGMANLLIAGVSFYLLIGGYGEEYSFHLFANGFVNSVLFFGAFFLSFGPRGMISDGRKIVELLRDESLYSESANRGYHYSMASALLLRESHGELADYIRGCERFDEYPELCGLLGHAYSFSFDYKANLYWAERCLSIYEDDEEYSSFEDAGTEFARAMARNNVAFALYCLGSTDCERMNALVEDAFDKAPWEEGIIGTYGAVKIRCGDAPAGISILEKQIARKPSLSKHNLALTYLCLAEGYGRDNRPSEMESALERAKRLDPNALEHLWPLLSPFKEDEKHQRPSHEVANETLHY